MKTIIVNVPDKHQKILNRVFKKLHLKSKILSAAELEEIATAKWIDKGMKSEYVSEKEIFELLRKHGIKI